MDDVSQAILDAWDKIWPWLKQNSDELKKRLARRHQSILQRPLRHHCLAVRASDRRITPMHWIITPSHAMDLDHEEHPYQPIEHEVLIQTYALRKFCRPVKIDNWGEEACDVEKRLGLSRGGLLKSRHAGNFTERNIPHLGGKPGPVPILHSRRPLDPGFGRFYAPPDPILGTLWQFLPDLLPDNFEQPVIRRPIFYPRSSSLAPFLSSSSLSPVLGGEGQGEGAFPIDPNIPLCKDDFLFRGYRWLCPSCQKLVRTIFYPLPIWNLCNFLALDPAKLPQFKNEFDPVEIPPPTFACRACHHIQHFSPAHSNSWNLLITHLTAGLLYGCEVPPPPWYQPYRKLRRIRHLTRQAPLRDQVLRRLLNGWSNPQISKDLLMSRNTVDRHIAILCHQEDVPDRHALVAKLGGTSPPLNQAERANKRRHQIQSLLLQGLDRHQIAQQLNHTLKSIDHDLTAIYKLHNVSTRGQNTARRALFQKLGKDFPPTPTDLLRQKIQTLHETGMTQTKIAQQLKVSRRAIWNHLKIIQRPSDSSVVGTTLCQ